MDERANFNSKAGSVMGDILMLPKRAQTKKAARKRPFLKAIYLKQKLEFSNVKDQQIHQE
ncbi:hypothetical protein GWO09_27430 [candidate division KSB1 bacterium]|nr:hypothetical protein [candidate division KSB1 bacterium]